MPITPKPLNPETLSPKGPCLGDLRENVPSVMEQGLAGLRGRPGELESTVGGGLRACHSTLNPESEISHVVAWCFGVWSLSPKP